MKNTMRITVSISLLLLLGLSQGCQTSKPNSYPLAGNPAITRLLKPIAQKHGVPALAAAVVTADGGIAVGVVGVRKAGGD